MQLGHTLPGLFLFLLMRGGRVKVHFYQRNTILRHKELKDAKRRFLMFRNTKINTTQSYIRLLCTIR
jgi:hypothetical protein